MARNWGLGRRGFIAAGVCMVAGGVAVLPGAVRGIGPWPASAASRAGATHATGTGATQQAREVTIASPRPDFVPVGGQGPSLSSGRVAWTATNGEGQTGSAIDRIYVYDLAHKRLGAPVRSHYGAAGFIGDYVLAGDTLAYVDTGVAPGRIYTWRVSVVDLRNDSTRVILTSPLGASSYVPPRIAFDGTRLLVLQSIDRTGAEPESMATLYTLGQTQPRILDRVSSPSASFADPTLAHNTALWTVQTFTPRASSKLMAYDLRRDALRALPVGDVSQLAASGDLVVWKTGAAGAPGGHIGVYSVQRGRVLDKNLAHSNKAIYPSIGGQLVSWTYADGSRVQIYSLTAGRIIYNVPSVAHRIYGLSGVMGGSASSSAVSWVYTANATGKGPQRGYVVVRNMSGE